jgi:hypothetical protein
MPVRRFETAELIAKRNRAALADRPAPRTLYLRGGVIRMAPLFKNRLTVP